MWKVSNRNPLLIRYSLLCDICGVNTSKNQSNLGSIFSLFCKGSHEAVKDPRDRAYDDVLKNVFDASLRRREKEPLKNIVEIWKFFDQKFPKEMYPLSDVKG